MNDDCDDNDDVEVSDKEFINYVEKSLCSKISIILNLMLIKLKETVVLEIAQQTITYIRRLLLAHFNHGHKQKSFSKIISYCSEPNTLQYLLRLYDKKSVFESK